MHAEISLEIKIRNSAVECGVFGAVVIVSLYNDDFGAARLSRLAAILKKLQKFRLPKFTFKLSLEKVRQTTGFTVATELNPCTFVFDRKNQPLAAFRGL